MGPKFVTVLHSYARTGSSWEAKLQSPSSRGSSCAGTAASFCVIAAKQTHKSIETFALSATLRNKHDAFTMHMLDRYCCKTLFDGHRAWEVVPEKLQLVPRGAGDLVECLKTAACHGTQVMLVQKNICEQWNKMATENTKL